MSKRKILFIIIILAAAITALTTMAQSEGRYVRKKQQPAFFIPQQEIAEKGEKLHMPKKGDYSKKSMTASDSSAGSKQRKNSGTNKELARKQKGLSSGRKAAEIEPEYEELLENNLENDADYQEKYQNYLEDLQEISNSGKIKNPQKVYDDLKIMNSEEMIEVDRNFNKTRKNPKEEFDQTLNRVLK